MAADLIRVRLHFDYAPPAALGCRLCWLLVDRGSCRVVADLESLIRERFELSRGCILRLFVEDCYLPHTESVLVVRDNDCVRVEVETVSQSTLSSLPSPVAASEKSRKRQRPAEDDAPVESALALELKKKKRKKSAVESPAVNGLHTEQEKTQESKNSKKKKTEEEKLKSPPAAPRKPSPGVKKPPKSKEKVVEKVVKGSKKPQSSSSSSSSSEDEQPAKKKTPKPATKPAPTAASARALTKKPPPPTSSSSSDTDSSSEDDREKSAKTKPAKSKAEDAQTVDIAQAANGADNGDGEGEEIELVIKKPVQHPRGRIVVGQQAGRGRADAKQQAPREPWGKGRGRGRGGRVPYSYNDRERDEEQPSYSTDSLTNVSAVFQNGVESRVSRPDYSSMPLLAAPPQVGQRIAFKLLELTENYTPEVSDYKEAKILSVDPTSKQIELELQTSFQAPVEPGKFDLVYQNADGSERVEYAVDRGSLVTERWDSLLEPRLVL